MTDILVIGSLNMDITLYVQHFPNIGETVEGSGMLMAPGGKGSNQALAASRLGATVRMAGCVGRDIYGDTLIHDMQDSGVDTSLIRVLPDDSTGLAIITVSNGSNMIVVNAGANNRITAEDIDAMEMDIQDCRAVILQLEIPMAAVQRAVELAHKHGKTVFLNPAPYKQLPNTLLAMVDYLVPNETEAMSMLGMDYLNEKNVADTLWALKAKGVRCPVITMGDKGAAYISEGKCHIDPCRKVTPVDSTAAGDTFIGAMASSLIKGNSLSEAIAFAQTAAAYCVSHKGAHTSIPTLADL